MFYIVIVRYYNYKKLLNRVIKNVEKMENI
jgi:hypothetical protein